MNSKSIGITILVLLIVGKIWGQTDASQAIPEIKPYKRAFTFSPFEFMMGTLKLDYEKYKTDSRFSFGATLVMSQKINNDFLEEYSRQTFGLDINNKIFATKFENKIDGYWNYYFNMGFRYQHITMGYDGGIWRSFTEDGIEYFILENKEIKPFAHRIAWVPQIGIQIRNNWLLLDFYGGLNFFKDFVRKNKDNKELPLDRYGDGSVAPMIGAKIGFMIRG